MKNIKVGDTVYHNYQMSNRGIVQEVYNVKTFYSNSAGTFVKSRRVKFLSELDGKIYDFKIEDVVKDN